MLEAALSAVRTEAILVLWVLLLLLLSAASKGRAYESAFRLTIIGLLMALAVTAASWDSTTEAAFDGAIMVRLDRFALAFHFAVLVGALLSLIPAWEYLRDRNLLLRVSEYCVLILLACSGAMLLVSATDLVIVFLAVDTLSLALYVLTGYASDRPYPTEAAIKYLLLGAMASAFLVYGIAFIYGASGTTNLLSLGRMVPTQPILLSVGLGLLVVGLAFKIALVPFHQWAPDVYDGALTPLTAFMTTAPKVAAIASLFRVMEAGFSIPQIKLHWALLLSLLAALTMTVGNLAALPQRNVKRMMAYSSIAHAGYMVMAVLALDEAGMTALVFYSLAYTFMTVGAFVATQLVEKENGAPAMLEEWTGLAHKNPVLGWSMVVFMAGLTGIPFTVGFWAKFLTFKAALEAGYLWLVVVAVLNSVISAFYYLRVAMVMFASPPTPQTRTVAPWRLAWLVMIVCAFVVIALGFMPTNLWKMGETVALAP
ncbi:MAG: NADH-quinone oxidoreductase subunit N [Armatimonadetes bacterium]|nr:NADH-quinone oxidoreductase subunit N [Armatimonadota bacterium]MCX7968154.1 NADH-quinone oxidoreductase subunit N [Armatimonadota bacterium]MDW8142036.1 NADH-quinone oxidoreductase subunit N [Armatimonadota bacterium]